MLMSMSGLEGVVAAETARSVVDGGLGELIIAGYPIAELAPNATFEQTVNLLWGEEPPAKRELPPIAYEVLRAAAGREDDPMEALRAAAGLLLPDQLLGAFPIIVAAYWRLLNGQEPIAPRADLTHAANYLYMLSGQ